ncbi:TPA: TIGR04255 family protein [Legionella pneumophila]|nr:TIGR04255 family protein [Legionella pneumophila]
MHPKLSKQPLTYVLAQVKFTSIEDIANYIPQLQNKIRDEFPHFDEVSIQAIQLREGERPYPIVFTQWHFMDKKKQMGIILDKHSVTIHSNKYERFQPFIDTFEQVISTFHDKLSFSLFTRLGLRYINFIKDGVDKINSGLQGFRLSGDKFPSNNFMAKIEATQPTQEGIIKIKSIHIENKDIINSGENIFVPPDLIDTAKLLSFEYFTKPQEAFLILDIDHFNNKQEDFVIPTIIDSFHKFHEIIYQGFCEAVGDENLSNWA